MGQWLSRAISNKTFLWESIEQSPVLCTYHLADPIQYYEGDGPGVGGDLLRCDLIGQHESNEEHGLIIK